MTTKFNSNYEFAVNAEGVPSTSLSPLTKMSGELGADTQSISNVLLPKGSYTGSVTLNRSLSLGYLMSFADSYLGYYQTDHRIESLLNFVSTSDPIGDASVDSEDNEIVEFARIQGQQLLDSNLDPENYDNRKLRTYNNFFRSYTNVGMRNLGISFDPSVMYVLGVTNNGYTYGGSSSGFMIGETFGAATGPDGLVVGIMDFTAATAGASIGGISGSMTGGVFALFVSEVGPTAGAGVTQFVVGSTGSGSSFGGTGEISWIYNINSLYIQGAKNSILKTIDFILPNVPMGMTVGTGNTAHQIRVYDQDTDHVESVIKGIEEGQERSDLVRGFSSGFTSSYTFTPRQFASYKYSSTVSLDPSTAITGTASEAQELSYYLTSELSGKRTTFDTHVRLLMQSSSEIDTLYKLSEWGIPETFKRLYEQ